MHQATLYLICATLGRLCWSLILVIVEKIWLHLYCLICGCDLKMYVHFSLLFYGVCVSYTNVNLLDLANLAQRL